MNNETELNSIDCAALADDAAIPGRLKEMPESDEGEEEAGERESLERRAAGRRSTDQASADAMETESEDIRLKREKRTEIFFKTERLLYFRLSFAAAGLVLCAGIATMARSDLDFPQLFCTIFGVVVYSTAALLLLKREVIHSLHWIPPLNSLLVVCDVLSLTSLVHYTHGVESDLYVLYLLPILLSSYTFGRRGITVTALLVSISYVGLLLVENASLLPYLVRHHAQEGLPLPILNNCGGGY